MAVVEVTAERAVPWMAPEDISVDELLTWGPDSETNHPEVVQVVFLDCHVESINLVENYAEWRVLLERIAVDEQSVIETTTPDQSVAITN